MSDLPTVEDILGKPPTKMPSVADILGPPPAEQPLWTGPEADEYAAASQPLGRVLSAFGQGAKTAWENGENLGYSDDVTEFLKKTGVYNDIAKGQGGGLRAFNEAMIRPVVSTVFALPGAIFRGTGAIASGLEGGVAQLGQEVGAPRAGQEAASLIEYAMTGQAHGGAPHPLPRSEMIGREFARGLTVGEVDHAAELGVIGPAGRAAFFDTPTTAKTSIRGAPYTQDVMRVDANAARGSTPVEPVIPTDIHSAARLVAPDVFEKYDPLAQQVDVLRGQIADAQAELRRNAELQAPHQLEIEDLQQRLTDTTPRLAKKYEARLAELIPERDAFLADMDKMALLTRDTPEIQAMREELQRTDYQMRDLAPDVTAAYREAAVRFPETQVEPSAEPVPTPAAEAPRQATSEPVGEGASASAPSAQSAQVAPEAPRSADVTATDTTAPVETPKPEAPQTDIRADVASKLQAVGRPAEEAQAAAELVAAHYEARAARFEGRMGTASEMYDRDAPAVRAGRSRARVAEMAQATFGKIRLSEARSIITLMKDANASTFMHETGHAWLDELVRDAKNDAAPDSLRADAATVRKWLGAGDGDLTTAQHEKFARGFERYLMEGHAPSRALDGVFAKFKDWLTKIYQVVDRLRSPINDDIRSVFDRLLTNEPERAVIAPERDIVSRGPEPKTPYLTPGREPLRLTKFLTMSRKIGEGIHEETIPGGLKDPNGEVAQVIGGANVKRGLINDRNGQTLDDAARRAHEEGFFPEHGNVRPDINDLLNAIREDHEGTPRYSMHDQDLVDAYNAAIAHNAEVDRLSSQYGIDPKGMTPTQFFDAVTAKATEEELAATIQDATSVHEVAFDEATAEARMWMEDHNIPWNGDEYYGLSGPRTLEELEAEHGQETASGSAGQGASAPDRSSDATRGQGSGQEGDGRGGRGSGDTGRTEAADTRGRAEQPDSPHDSVEDLPEFVDKAGNIRLDNLNAPDDVKELLRELAAQNDDFMDARGGVISDVERRAMADSLGLSFDNFVPQKPEGVSNSVWTEAVQKLTFQATEEVSRLGKAFGESGSPQDAAAYLSAKQRLLMIADYFSGLTAESGRTLRVFDKRGIAFTGDLVAMMERDTGRTLYQMQQEAKAIGEMDTVAKRAKMAQDTRDPTMWQKSKSMIVSYFINNLISGPLTHAGYGIGNEVWAMFKAVPLTLAEATIDTVRAGLGGAPIDRVYYGEVGAQIWGHFRGMRDGFTPGVDAARTGISFMKGAEELARIASEDGQQGTLVGMSPMGENALRPQVIPGKVGYVLETPSRVVSAIHTVFYSMNYEREIARRAYRAAANEGLTGDAFQTRVAELTMNPPPAIIEAAHNEALNAVLMKRPEYGTDRQLLVKVVNNNLALKLAMPFMQIGLNILDEGLVQSTPIGLASQFVRDNLAGRNGEVARSQQYARIMVGSGLASGVMALTAQGIITGSGPSDPNERRLMEATGWKADSIRIGDTYYPYRKFLGPLGPLVVAAANVHDVAHLLSDGHVAKAAGAATMGFAQAVIDETWMKGISDFMQAATHWDKDGEKYIKGLATSFIPFSSAMSQTAHLVDDYQRMAHSVTDAFLAKIPGLSQTLYPQRDWTGTPIASHSQLSPSVWKNDQTMAAMLRAEFYPASVRRDINGVPLTDQQYDQLSQVAGNLAKSRMDMLVSAPGFLDMPLGVQHKLMAQTLAKSREVAETFIKLQPGNENIIRQSSAAKAAQVRGELPGVVRDIRRTAP